MSYRQVRLILGTFSMAVVFTILADNFLLPQKTIVVTIKNKMIDKSAGYRGSRAHFSFLLTGKAGEQYNVGERCFYSIDTGTSISTSHTALFNKTTGIDYFFRGKKVHDDTGVISASYFGKAVCGITLFFSALCVFFPGIFKNQELPARITLVCCWITIVILLFYFLFQPS